MNENHSSFENYRKFLLETRYDEKRISEFKKYISNQDLYHSYFFNKNLPQGYGKWIDERIVEYPWVFSKLSKESIKILDAGSALNNKEIISHPKLKDKQVYICTLYPETQCFWEKKISYIYDDLRDMPFKDSYFDSIISISTIEHIGMNNSVYSKANSKTEYREKDYLKVAGEFNRIVMKRGQIMITVPYGNYKNFLWFQIFDQNMINKVIDKLHPEEVNIDYFCYTEEGWKFSDAEECLKYKYYDPADKNDSREDGAIAARSIACIEILY